MCMKPTMTEEERILTLEEKVARLQFDVYALQSKIDLMADRKTEPTISKMEQVDKDINVRSKDEPQTHTVDLGNGFSITANDCDTCKHRDKPFDDLPCDMCCKAHSGYEPKDEPHIVGKHADVIIIDEPQTDCAWGKDG